MELFIKMILWFTEKNHKQSDRKRVYCLQPVTLGNIWTGNGKLGLIALQDFLAPLAKDPIKLVI